MPVQFQGALVKRRQLLVDILVVNVALYTQKDKGIKKKCLRGHLLEFICSSQGVWVEAALSDFSLKYFNHLAAN